MRIGVIGCGGIANVQVPFILQRKGRQIVAVCDQDEKRASEFKQLFRIPKSYTCVSQLLQEQRPDVVHVITPPQAHASVALQAIEAGCHVFVEKPMAASVDDADAMIEAAKARGVKLCVDHNQLFDPVTLRARRLVEEGFVGSVIGIESYYGFDISQVSPRRWVDALFGGMFQDVAPHPLSLILYFLEDPIELHTASLGNGSLGARTPGELRVLMKGKNAVGTVSISMAIKPHVNFLKIYGSKAILNADLNNMILSIQRSRPLPKAAARGLMSVEEGIQLATGAVGTAFKFVLGRIKSYPGMGNIINAFYDSVEHDRAVPVTGEDGRRVVEIFNRIRREFPQPASPPVQAKPRTGAPSLFVTGATGFLGSHLIEALVEQGTAIRALVRPTSRVTGLNSLGIDWVDGGMSDVKRLKEAMDGCDIVVHCAAATSGSWADYLEATVRGTERILAASEAVGVKKLVYISSLSVYAMATVKRHQVIIEDFPIEPYPEKVGLYARAKIEAEKLVLRCMQEKRVPIAILRPGLIYGPRGTIFSPAVGYNLKNRVFVTIGPGKNPLPFVYVGNVVDAIWLAATRTQAIGGIYNIVDDEQITQEEYIREFAKGTGGNGLTVHMPFSVVYLASAMLEAQAAITNRTPFLTRYRLVCATRIVRYDTSRAKAELHWQPKVSLQEGLKRTFESRSNQH
jgi:predicted dehydrogenase/nucleoside-diphosphate-sugar epimerase